jgi:segregation and condensation protein B
VEEHMTEKSQEIEEIQEDQDLKETAEVQEVQDVPEAEEAQEEQDVPEAEDAQEEQDVPEAEDVQEAQDVHDDEPQMPDEQQPDISQPDQEITTTVESVVEAVLFASDESLTDARLASIVETSAKQVRQHIKNLNDKYQANNNAFRIEQIAGGYQMLTLSPYNLWLKKLLRVRGDNKLSPAAMETLAIVAYKQPVMRADIEAIRGVAVGEVIRSLSYKGLVKIVGRAEVLGRPMLYGTTKKFLEVFGLNALKDLPKAQELKEPSL